MWWALSVPAAGAGKRVTGRTALHRRSLARCRCWSALECDPAVRCARGVSPIAPTLDRVARLPAPECRRHSSRAGLFPGPWKRHATKTCSSIGSVALTGQRLVHRAVERSLATLTIVALFVGVVGVSATAASAVSSPRSLRAQVDAIGNRYFAAQARAAALDAEVRGLDQQLSRSRRRAAALRPLATAEAVQLYQSSSESFTAVLDTTNAMESARRAELISQASDHTQALLNDYMNAAATLSRQRRSVERARAAQAAVVAALAKQQSKLEHLLAQAQQAYRPARARREAQLISTRRAPPRAARAPVSADRRHRSPEPAGPGARRSATAAERREPPPRRPVPGLHTHARELGRLHGAVNPGGYYGAYQFSQPTWDVTANHAGMPAAHRRAPRRGVAVGSGSARVGAARVAGQRALGRSLLAAADRSAHDDVVADERRRGGGTSTRVRRGVRAQGRVRPREDLGPCSSRARSRLHRHRPRRRDGDVCDGAVAVSDRGRRLRDEVLRCATRIKRDVVEAGFLSYTRRTGRFPTRNACTTSRFWKAIALDHGASAREILGSDLCSTSRPRARRSRPGCRPTTPPSDGPRPSWPSTSAASSAPTAGCSTSCSRRSDRRTDCVAYGAMRAPLPFAGGRRDVIRSLQCRPRS